MTVLIAFETELFLYFLEKSNNDKIILSYQLF